MEKKLKVLGDVEIVNDKTNFELEKGFGQFAYSYQACGGGGGCGGCGGGCGGCGGGCGGGRYIDTAK
ncbi:hypothetical protein D7X98_09570 [bacterium 1XD8-76]|nr:hypothetical protein D7X98_09570 [bacterium 1XD8-76]